MGVLGSTTLQFPNNGEFRIEDISGNDWIHGNSSKNIGLGKDATSSQKLSVGGSIGANIIGGSEGNFTYPKIEFLTDKLKHSGYVNLSATVASGATLYMRSEFRGFGSGESAPFWNPFFMHYVDGYLYFPQSITYVEISLLPYFNEAYGWNNNIWFDVSGNWIGYNPTTGVPIFNYMYAWWSRSYVYGGATGDTTTWVNQTADAFSKDTNNSTSFNYNIAIPQLGTTGGSYAGKPVLKFNRRGGVTYGDNYYRFIFATKIS